MGAKLKWKEIYNKNKQRKYLDVTGVKTDNIGLESNPSKIIKEKSFWVVLVILIITIVILYSFRSNIKLALGVLAFFAVVGLAYFFFNYFKLECQKDGLFIKFGIQKGTFKYDKIKSVYISRFNDTSYIPFLCTYNIVIRYLDGFNRIKELYFDTTFLPKEQVDEFINNFEVSEAENEKYVAYERYKLLKKLGKIALFVLFFAGCLYLGLSKQG